jgi:hypothetical protein
VDNAIHELFGIDPPTELDTLRLLKYFRDLKQAIDQGAKDMAYSDETKVEKAMEIISNELSWFEDDFVKLVEAYDQAMAVIDDYQSLLAERVDEEEQFKLNAIRVKHRFIRAHSK